MKQTKEVELLKCSKCDEQIDGSYYNDKTDEYLCDDCCVQDTKNQELLLSDMEKIETS
jgi:formylmethanofuran dehydrogenase subunit E